LEWESEWGRVTGMAIMTRIMTLTGRHLTVCTDTIRILRMRVRRTDIGGPTISMTASLSAQAHGSDGDLGRASATDSVTSKTFIGLADSTAAAFEIFKTMAACAISGAGEASAGERPTTVSAVERLTTDSVVEHRARVSEAERPTVVSVEEHPTAAFTVARLAAASVVVQQVASIVAVPTHKAVAHTAVEATAVGTTNTTSESERKRPGDLFGRSAAFFHISRDSAPQEMHREPPVPPRDQVFQNFLLYPIRVYTAVVPAEEE